MRFAVALSLGAIVVMASPVPDTAEEPQTVKISTEDFDPHYGNHRVREYAAAAAVGAGFATLGVAPFVVGPLALAAATTTGFGSLGLIPFLGAAGGVAQNAANTFAEQSKLDKARKRAQDEYQRKKANEESPFHRDAEPPKFAVPDGKSSTVAEPRENDVLDGKSNTVAEPRENDAPDGKPNTVAEPRENDVPVADAAPANDAVVPGAVPAKPITEVEVDGTVNPQSDLPSSQNTPSQVQSQVQGPRDVDIKNGQLARPDSS